MHLPLNNVRVDGPPHIVGGNEFQDLGVAGGLVHLHDGGLGGVGIGGEVPVLDALGRGTFKVADGEAGIAGKVVLRPALLAGLPGAAFQIGLELDAGLIHSAAAA